MEDLKSVGDDFFNKNMFEEAIDKYTLALDFDSDDKYKIYLNRCLSFYKLKKYNKALSDAIKATKLKQDNAKSWGRLGSCLSILGRKSQAIYAFKKAYELEPLNENYKIESNKELDLNDFVTEEDKDEKEEDKQECTKEEDKQECTKEDESENKKEDETEDEEEEDDEEEDDEEEDEEEDDEEEDEEEDDEEDDEDEDDEQEQKEKQEEEQDEQEKEETKFPTVPTLNFMPNVDTLLNNPMFNKMLHNEELIEKMSDQTFQDKILSYQFNPFEVLKDKEIMSFMTSILTKKN